MFVQIIHDNSARLVSSSSFLERSQSRSSCGEPVRLRFNVPWISNFLKFLPGFGNLEWIPRDSMQVVHPQFIPDFLEILLDFEKSRLNFG